MGLALVLSMAGWAFGAEVIVDTAYVAKQKDKAGVVVLDARAGKAYSAGHIPGAITLGGRGAAVVLRDVDARILPVKTLEKILGEAGISRDMEIIVYATKGDTGMTVPFWILEYLGAEKVRAYWGGIDDWKAAKQPVAAEERKLPAAKFVALSEKRADAVPDYTTGQPFWEKAVGKDNLVMMPWHRFGFDTYSMSIFASEKTMNERPKVLRDFLEASYKGWRDVMADPRAALEIFKKRVPEIDLALIEPNMMLGLDLMRTDRFAQNGIGWMDRSKMCRTVELINTYMDVPRKVGCDEVFTNSFLTKIEPPKSMK